jgi:hypothetical protein
MAKYIKLFLIFSLIISTFNSCKLWNSIFNKEPKRGCATDGRNIGAERVLELKGSDAKKAKKAKFRG